MCQIAPVKYGWYLVYDSKVASDAYVYSAGTISSENIDVVLKYYFYFNNWSLCSDVPNWVKEFGSCVKISTYLLLLAIVSKTVLQGILFGHPKEQEGPEGPMNSAMSLPVCLFVYNTIFSILAQYFFVIF